MFAGSRWIVLAILGLFVAACGREASAERAAAEARWRAAIAAADADPEVQRAADAAKDAEVAFRDARERAGRREHDVVGSATEQLYQEALARAARANVEAKDRWRRLRTEKALETLAPGERERLESVLGPLGDADGAPGAAVPARGGRVAVIPKGTTQVFWKSVEAGVREAAASEGLDVVWKGPLTEDDRAQQIQLVQQFTTEGVAGIVLAPLDARALLAPVRAARARGIPVVIFDSALAGERGTDFASFVATDNHAAGKLAGGVLAKLMRGKGKVVMLRYQVGSASTEAREEGFREVIAAQPDMELIVDNRHAGATVSEAKTQALNLIDKLREAGGVFCCNEMTTHGMLLALQQEGLAGKIRFVGFDASPVLVAGVENREIDALVVQNPRRMGREAVVQMARILRGETPDPRVDTGTAVVDREALAKPEIQELLR